MYFGHFCKICLNRTEEIIGIARLVTFEIEISNLRFKLFNWRINIQNFWSKVLKKRHYHLVIRSANLFRTFLQNLSKTELKRQLVSQG